MIAPRAQAAHLPATSLSVIVPATNEPQTLGEVLPPIEAGLYPGEQLVVVLSPRNSGPARARNDGVLNATGDVVVFVDADVVIHPDALDRIRAAFDADPGLTAMFGSYDDGPESLALVSQFRNLLHHHVHQSCPGPARTFWAGLGAVRREAFLALGGFDEQRFPVASVEDVDLGLRISLAGGRIELHPKVQGTHLKHWTLWTMVRTDFLLRGIPWVKLIFERRTLAATLNLSWRERASTGLTIGALAAVALRSAKSLRLALLLTAIINARFHWLLWRRMGAARATAAVMVHAVHRLAAVASVPAGVLSYRAEQARAASAGNQLDG